MYTMMKRLTSLLLAVCMLVAILPAGMFSASAATVEYLYNFADGLKASAGENKLNLMDAVNASAFSTMSTYTGSTASWRLAREKTTTTLVQHNGSSQTDFGVFVFAGGDNMNKYATFEINVPESGTYQLGLTYYDYDSARSCDVYLISASLNQPILFDASERVLSLTYSDLQCPKTGVLEAKGSHGIPLAAGNYYLVFRPASSHTTGHNYLFLHNVRLSQTSTSTATAVGNFAISGNNGSVMGVNSTRQLRALLAPHNVNSGYVAQPAIIWGSTRESVASVSAGTVTAKAAGSTVIFAREGEKRREMVSVLVGDSRSQLYAINEDAQNYMRAASVTEVDFTKTYTSYVHTTSADRWCYAHSSNPSNKRVSAYTSNDNSWYGTFLDIGGVGSSVTFKIEVEQDGNYLPEIAYIAAPPNATTQESRGGSVKANVYIYPTTYAAGSCPEESYVTYTGSNSTSKTLSMASGSGPIALRKGDYYVTFKTDSEVGRYVYLQHIALIYQSAYSSPSVKRIVINNPSPKMTAGDTKYQLGVQVQPSTADQLVSKWGFAVGQNSYISVNNGVLTADSNRKGSNVISATVGVREEVTSVSTGALLYTFNNVAKDYLTKNSLNSVAFDYFDDYSKISTGDKWVYVNQDVSSGVLPTVYQGMDNLNERYGAFLDFGTEAGKWIRFKIKVDKGGWYFPEVLYRDNGPSSLRETDVYLSPINVDPYTMQVMTITPDSNAPNLGTIKAKRSAESMYLAEGEYYLTFYTGTPLNETAHYLYLYHLALVEDDDSKDVIAPKAVIIEKPDAAMAPLAVGDTVQLSARVLPVNAVQTITSWKSSNTDVAEVDPQTGLVTAKANGVALITATARDARSETVVIQVGEDAQVYAFNEVIKKYAEKEDLLRVDISNCADFSDNNYLWKDTYSFGQNWRFVTKTSDGISTAYRGDSGSGDVGNDNTDPNYKYGLFLLGNSHDSYIRFEIEVDEDGEYLPEIIHYLSVNASETQGSRQAEIYISPITTPEKYLMHDAYHVGTTTLMKSGARETIVTDYGLISHNLNPIMLKKGKYNLIIKSGGIIGRYLYLHAIALHKQDEFSLPNPVDIVFTNHDDEVVYLGANATYNLSPMIHPLLADQSIIWNSSDNSIASVTQNGVVTTQNVTEGTALITAVSTVDGSIAGKVRVIIGQKAAPKYKYDFVNPIRSHENLTPNQDLGEAYSFTLLGKPAFDGSYDGSKLGGHSAPWMFYGTNGTYCNFTNSTHKQGYGLFVMSSKTPGTYTQFKFKVDEDANYGTVLNISDWTKSNDFDVYLAPAAAIDPMEERWKVASHHITKCENLYYGLELGERTLYAGEYILTIRSTDVNFLGTNGGLVAIHDLTLTRTGDAFYTIEGAQVRIAGINGFGKNEKQGLRFISTLHKSEYNVDSSDVKEFGTLLLPKSKLTDTNRDGKIDGFDLTETCEKVAMVVAKNRYVDNLGYTVFTAVITDLAAQHYDMVVVARAYVKLADGKYYYADTWTERSIYQVAKNGLERAESFKEGEQETLEAIVNAVETAE